MDNLLEGYSVVIEIPVVWGEMDAFQHVNNVVYFRYFEDARIAYYERLNILDLMARIGVGPILAATSCRFRMPLTYPDKVLVGAKVSNIEQDRFMMNHIVVSTRLKNVAAEGDAVVVIFNYRENKKAIIPDELRRLIQDIESTNS